MPYKSSLDRVTVHVSRARLPRSTSLRRPSGRSFEIVIPLSISQGAKMSDSIKNPEESIIPPDRTPEVWLVPQPSSDQKDPLVPHPRIPSP